MALVDGGYHHGTMAVPETASAAAALTAPGEARWPAPGTDPRCPAAVLPPEGRKLWQQQPTEIKP